MRASLRHGKWTPSAKATVRFVARPALPSLAERISAARLTAIRARQWAEIEPAGSALRKRLLAQAEVWEAKAAELTRIQRGRQTPDLPLF